MYNRLLLLVSLALLHGCANQELIKPIPQSSLEVVRLNESIKFKDQLVAAGTLHELIRFEADVQAVMFSISDASVTGGGGIGGSPLILGPSVISRYGVVVDSNLCASGDWIVRSSVGKLWVDFTRMKPSNDADRPWVPKRFCFKYHNMK